MALNDGCKGDQGSLSAVQVSLRGKVREECGPSRTAGVGNQVYKEDDDFVEQNEFSSSIFLSKIYDYDNLQYDNHAF